MKEEPTTVRLDRWLFAARFYKTRTQAAKACDGGKVKVNGISAKPHRFLRVGDDLTIHHRGRYRNIHVLSLAERRLPAREAIKLYSEEVTQKLSKEDEELYSFFRAVERKYRPKFKGRPTKRERRQMEKLKREIHKI